MTSLHFIVGSKHLGTCQVQPTYATAFGEYARTPSVAYFCNRCGDVWARLLVQPSEWTAVWQQDCQKHGGHGLLSEYGELHGVPPARLSDEWPIEVLRYELERSIQFAERRNE